MTKTDMINIKLEVCRDKTSGKLLIMALFDDKAPNVSKDKDGYYWMPTESEKEFLDDAFRLMPMDSEPTPHKMIATKQEEIMPTTKSQQMQEEQKPMDMPQMEKTDEPDIFEVTKEESNTEYMNNMSDNKIEEPSPVEPQQPNQNSSDMEAEKKEEDEKIIVEADSEAIEAALKKHTNEEDDKSLIAADEQTIVDKVLSQKKKGKWSRH